MVSSFLRAWFGDFNREELKKFIRLGVIFAFVIGVYWTLRPLKDGIFTQMVNNPENVKMDSKKKAEYIPYAKVLSLFLLLPLVIAYSTLVEKYPRHHMFYALGLIYALITIVFGLIFMHPTIGLANQVGSVWRITGWLWYVFVESYGSLMVALFWAFAADTTTPESAKRGFGLTVMLGQLGSIAGPLLLGKLGLKYFGSEAPIVLLCAPLILLIIVGIRYFMSVTPAEQLIGFHGKNEAKVEEQQEPGFLEGLKLMLQQPYLLGIFGIVAIYEILVTIIDFNFKGLVTAQFGANSTGSSLYLADYAIWVNVVAFFCLLFGVSNIQRYLGTTVSLAIMPFVICGMVGLFLVYPNVEVLFYIMVTAKAINYALNGPVMKQLYVPTTPDVKYKSQAWIETFGSRSSKTAGSGINIVSNVLGTWFTPLISLTAFGLGGVWFFIALYLGKTHKHAVDNKKVVC
jgi:ATP:ADP antiporter, AAA family